MNEFAKDVVKVSVINLAASVAGTVGLFGGLIIVGTILERKTKKEKRHLKAV